MGYGKIRCQIEVIAERVANDKGVPASVMGGGSYANIVMSSLFEIITMHISRSGDRTCSFSKKSAK